MSLDKILADPCVQEHLSSKDSHWGLLGYIGQEFGLWAASPAFRQHIGFDFGTDLLIQRYGPDVLNSLKNAVNNGENWSAHVRIAQQWYRLDLSPQHHHTTAGTQPNRPTYSVLGERPSKLHTNNLQEQDFQDPELTANPGISATPTASPATSTLAMPDHDVEGLLESLSDAFFSVDAQACVAHLNSKASELIGLSPEQARGKKLMAIAPMLRNTPLYKHLNAEACNNTIPPTNGLCFEWQDLQNKTWYQVRVLTQTHITSIFFTDISTIKANEHKMQHQATHDALTGLPNRLSLCQTLNEIVDNQQVQNLTLGVLFIDLDGFKSVNDTLGHDYGDQLLIEVTKRLQSVVRKTDLVARLAGDEFVIVIPYSNTPEHAQHIGKKVVDVIGGTPFELAEKPVHVGASVGVALYPNDAKDVDTLLKHADLAMYQAKHAGKNTVRAFAAHMSNTHQNKLDIEHELHEALRNERIELHYQPRFSSNGGICAVEALARMRSQHGELIQPMAFVPIAEETGLIVRMGEQVLRQACAWLVETNAKLSKPIAVSVNVSGIQLLNGQLPSQVANILQETGLPSEWLELELTETVLMQNHDAIINNLHILYNMGVRLAIDDFGTGYSSLAMLHKLPVQSIKLDRSFVKELPHQEDSVIISRTVLAMAKALGLGVVAEGVETEAQRDFLIDNGVLELQGFGLARPMPASQALQFICSQELDSTVQGVLDNPSSQHSAKPTAGVNINT